MFPLYSEDILDMTQWKQEEEEERQRQQEKEVEVHRFWCLMSLATETIVDYNSYKVWKETYWKKYLRMAREGAK